VAALAVQGPTAGALLKRLAGEHLAGLKYFRMMHGELSGIPVDISRTGYTGDLGYEVWVPWNRALDVWDTVFTAGRQFDVHATGMLALDIARIEAGLLLIDVDYISSKKALIESQKFSPYELGFDRLVHLEKDLFVGKRALAEEQRRGGPPRRLIGLEFEWTSVEQLFDRQGLPPQPPSTASRVHVPVYSGNKQVGKATSTTWSPLLKKMIALGSVEARHSAPGTKLDVEVTVEAVRYRAAARVTKLPFYNPPRKTKTPV
jgi:aminomethyltransferase